MPHRAPVLWRHDRMRKSILQMAHSHALSIIGGMPENRWVRVPKNEVSGKSQKARSGPNRQNIWSQQVLKYVRRVCTT